jgi:hypothetical protein
MIEPHDEQIHREPTLMPLLFASYENYVRSSKSFQEGLNWMEYLNIYQKPTKYGKAMFCEAVKVDMEKFQGEIIQEDNNKHSFSHHCVI